MKAFPEGKGAGLFSCQQLSILLLLEEVQLYIFRLRRHTLNVLLWKQQAHRQSCRFFL